ncbi:hypothetical protein PIB30_087134 [Stylosanthes scabra]|uniref:Uncharacterized protein n=1 Tax=Stylosanthes scabra TaxID=79078 RepID=A0ABU6YUR1_9FABA|nr:hypothetical protein [Stylosanthes scabra]
METIRFPRNQPQQQQEDEKEDEAMPQADGGNFEEEDQQPPHMTSSHYNMVFPTFSLDIKANTMRTFKALRKPSLVCSFSSKPSMKTCRNPKRITWRRSSN